MRIYKIPKITKDEHVITSVETWFQFAPPKDGAKQWVDGRSAKELAKAWFPASGMARVPVELEKLLASHDDVIGAEITHGSPEVRIRLDDFPGETRNADLVLLSSRGKEQIVLTIEAKADEPFDMTIGEKLDSAPKGSNIPKRVEQLCLALFGSTPADKSSLKNLRYQLLNATAATLIEAKQKNACKAVFVIHEFVTDKTASEKLNANQNDLVSFTKELSRGAVTSVPSGVLFGPLNVPGGTYVPANMPLYLGKIRSGAGI